MKKLINKKILLIILNLLLILSCIVYYAVNNNHKLSNSITKENKLEGTELEDDNWELSVVFYDSTVDNGNTPLTEINWTANDKNDSRVITIQVNYKNTNTQREYKPGEIKISVDKIQGRSTGGMNPDSVSAGSLANGYEWSYNGAIRNGNPLLDFYNNVKIEKNTNFEGSIQFVYSIPAFKRYDDLYNNPWNTVDDYASPLIYGVPEEVMATLEYKGQTIDSSPITLNFDGPKTEYTLKRETKKLTALDGLENANDYIWIKYVNFVKRLDDKPRNAHVMYFKEFVPDGGVVYDTNLSQIDVINNEAIIYYKDESYVDTSGSSGGNGTTYYIGYPKSTYTDEVLENTAKLYGTYTDETEPSLLAEDTKTFNMNDYIFTYTGELYGLVMSTVSIMSVTTKYDYGTLDISVSPKTIYTGEKYDLILSEDYVALPTEAGTKRKINESEYNITNVRFSNFANGNNQKLTGYEADVFVRYRGTDEFVEYPQKMVFGAKESITFSEENIVDVKVIIKDLECGIGNGSLYFQYKINMPDITETEAYGIYLAYMQIRQNDEIVNTPTLDSYSSLAASDLAQSDLEKYGTYLQRGKGSIRVYPNQITYYWTNDLSNVVDRPTEEKFVIKSYYSEIIRYTALASNNFTGTEMVNLLPEGIDVESSEEEIREDIKRTFLNHASEYKRSSGVTYDNQAAFLDYFLDHLDVEIIRNYNNTNRTMLRVKQDFSDDPLVISPGGTRYKYPDFHFNAYLQVSYSDYVEFGPRWENTIYGFLLNQDTKDYSISLNYNPSNIQLDSNDLNTNGITDEYYYKNDAAITIYSAIETHQDVQTSVQSNVSNFATGKVNVLKNDEYTYKLRVRTGAADVTNLVIYDSLEDYAKNPDLEIVKASGGKPAWHGELLDIDKSYAESKGYTVKVYYNENSNPGTLAEDNTWQEYTDSTDKTLVKALAFKYLNSEGNPAVLPANTNTYVLIKMKSPNEDLTYFTYNGCWTEWNAIDSVTGRPVDFITGINSNIVKVALPTSIESYDRDITFEKEWKDNNNSLGVRPQSVKYNLIPNGHPNEAIEVELTGTGNIWQTTMSVPAVDEYGLPIIYTIEEQPIEDNNGYRYIAEKTDTFKYTNTLNKRLLVSKEWVDNRNAYNTRPSSISIKIMQNGNYYKTVTWGGDLTVNAWGTSSIGPVFDNNGNEYTYTVEEDVIDGYSSSCSALTCTNTLTGNEEFTIKKVWQDNNNEYSTRPSSIDVKLKRNGEVINTYTLSGNSNTWETPTIIANKYDANGVKYVYTIDETPLDEYGQVTYDQANHKVTNTLKKNISITVTKNWIDGSNEQGLRPDSLTINLLRNNSQYQTLTLTGDSDTWSTTIEVPKYDDDQNLYTYSIRELTDNLNEDYSNITYSEQELSVTNKLEKKIDIKISKIWDDGDNELLTRPEKLNINLLRNGTLYQELELIPSDINDNTWELNIEDLDAYDSNGAKYTYTIEENLIDQLARYETITYDQTNYTITNKLTVPPKVTLYFTVKNGYIPNGSDEIQYDEEGYNNVLSAYNLNGEDEYTFNFELENVDTGEIIKGKLSTQGTLEFDDVPYGTYRAREGEDKYFDFVSMVEITEVLGVTFTQDERGGTITISPTGQDIVYGAHITNKIEYAKENPNTSTSKSNLIFYILLIAISTLIGIYFYRRYKFVK